MTGDREILELLEQAVAKLRGRIYQSEHDPEAEARATLLAYNAEHPDAPMTYWPGGEKAPEDWDGKDCLREDGAVRTPIMNWCDACWSMRFSADEAKIIGYRAKAQQPEPVDPVGMEDAIHVAIPNGWGCMSSRQLAKQLAENLAEAYIQGIRDALEVLK